MSGRLWLILFLLTVAIGVTVWMSSANKAELPPPEEASLEEAPVPHVNAPTASLDNPFVAPPTREDRLKAKLEAEAKAAGTEGLPGPSDPLVAPPTATPAARKDEFDTPDGIPTPSYASPPPGNFPPPAYPPQVYPDSGLAPQDGGGFEGDIPPPPEGGNVDYDPEIGSGGEAPLQEDGSNF